jgi:uncharacterized protein DUF6174
VIRQPLLAAAALAVLLAGCTSSPEPTPAATTAPASAPAWSEPANYTFVADRRCADGESLGRYRVLVTGGTVSSAERIDGRTAEGEEEIQVPTLGELLELANTAVEDGADATTVLDPADGHPVEVSINRAEEATGGADCFRISEYAPTP